MNETFTLSELEILHHKLAFSIALTPEGQHPDREVLNLQGKVTRMIAQELKDQDGIKPVAAS